jgi:exopolysaccharide biosynthesis polyprenyl glycosylphosphotransferase
MKSRLAVVLPAYNEEASLESLLWRIHRALNSYDYWIVVVDDGSSDETAAIARRLSDQIPIRLVCHGTNRGYGAAIRTGMLAGREIADSVVTMDADDSHDPSLIPLMLTTLECGSDLIIASRFVPGGRMVGVPFHRTMLSYGAAVVFDLLIRIPGVKDYTCGYRAYSGDLIDRFVATWGRDRFVIEPGFCVGVELLAKADVLGASLSEVPLVLRYDRKLSDSKLDLRSTLLGYVDLVKRVRREKVATPSGASRRSVPWLQERGGLEVAAGVGADAGGVLLAFLLSFLSYEALLSLGLLVRPQPDPSRYAWLALLFAATTVLTFWQFGLYRSRSTVLILRHLETVARALTVSIALFFVALFFLSGKHPSRLIVFGAFALSYPIVLLTRRLTSYWIRSLRIRSGEASRILIYGVGDVGRLLMKKLLNAPRLGAEVVGFLDDRESPGRLVRCRVSQMHGREFEARVLGSGSDLARVARETRATELCIAIPDLNTDRLERLREEAEALGLELGIVPRFGDLRPDQLVVEDIGAVPVLRFNRPRSSRFLLAAKRAVDIVGVLALAPIAIPLGLLVAAAVRFDGKPILFRQTRIGRAGRPFTLLKFRTMSTRVDPYENSPADLSDPRLTRVGRIIRLAGLDELPQLLNVLKGEMSLVGPRPEMPQIVARYGDVERSRLSTRPGLTGIWQLSPDRSQAIHENLEYDLYYLSRNSLILDFLILGETLFFFARALGSSLARGFRKLDPEAIARSLDPRTLRDRWPGSRPERPKRLVFVALDQRRRPDEPSSWSSCVPRVSSLGSTCAVKLLAASANRNRLSELAPMSSEDGSEPGLEFVPYEPDSVRLLATEADCVVTDLGHVAEWAFGAGVPTFLIRDKEDLEIGTNGPEAAFASVVRSALTGAAPGPPAIA